MLMLSYADAELIFSGLKLVIVDEIHVFAHSKRGDFTALRAPGLRRSPRLISVSACREGIAGAKMLLQAGVLIAWDR